MNRLAILGLVLLTWLPARAATNLPPASSLLPDASTSLKLTAGLAEYDNPPKLAGKFTSTGGGSSAILISRWAVEFAKLCPEVGLDSHGGGSAEGLAALLEGKVDLVPMNRPLPADYVARFKAKFGHEPAQIVVAQDAEGVYVNKNNPIAGLTLAQLDSIYSRDSKRGGGRPEFWGGLGVEGPLADKPVDRFSLSRVHSSYRYFQEQVMQGSDYRLSVSFETVPGSLVQAVGADDAAIGFESVMFATARTRFVPLQGSDGRYLLPSYENTVSGQYPLVTPQRIVFNRQPDGGLNPVAREFLRFTVSRRGQRVIAFAGSYPITLEQQQEALRIIGEAPKPDMKK